MKKLSWVSPILLFLFFFQISTAIGGETLIGIEAIVDLGTLGGTSSGANAINNNGWVTGNSFEASNPNQQAFIYKGSGNLIKIPTLGGLWGRGSAINEAGVVVGVSETSGGLDHPFVSINNVTRDLGVFNAGGAYWGEAFGVNNNNQIVGYENCGTDGNRAFLCIYSTSLNGCSERRQLCPTGRCTAEDINDSGIIVGQYITGCTSGAAKYNISTGQWTCLAPLETGKGAAANSISSNNLIAGHAVITGDYPHAVMWNANGTIKDLKTLAADPATGKNYFASGLSVNQHGQVVGFLSHPDHIGIPSYYRAFFSDGVRMINLTNLLPSGSAWTTLNYASDIADDGRIVGWGLKSNGEGHGFILKLTMNQPPILDFIGLKSVNEGQLLTFAVTGSDPDANAISFAASNLPTGANFNPSTQIFSWTPTYAQAGSYKVLFTLTDNGNPVGSAQEEITITVGNVNAPPELAPVGNMVLAENEQISFQISAIDPDSDSLSFSVSGLPLGASFNDGAFSWTPDYAQAGTYNVLFSVTDNGAPPLSDNEEITITVGNVNRPPVLSSIGNKSANEGGLLEFTITATDPDGDRLQFAAGALPDGATFDNQKFTWMPGYNQAASYMVTFRVTDINADPLSDVETITITVGNVNRPPVLSPIGNKTGNENEPLEFTVTGTDPDGDSLVYEVSGLPSGATFGTNDQRFSWIPSYAQSGSYFVEFTVKDIGTPMELDTEQITITVGNINRVPVFTAVGPQFVNENQSLSFNVQASDPDGDSLFYSASNLPAGALFIPVDRFFSWTPAYGQQGSYMVTIRATDSCSPPFYSEIGVSITVGQSQLTPAQLLEKIIQTVLGLHLSKAVENSYMANLKKVAIFIQNGQITAAINQMNAFINKVQIDIPQGNISMAEGNNLINLANQLISMLKP